MLQAKAFLNKIKPYTPGQSIESIQAHTGLDKVIKLASNENPLGPAVNVTELSTIKAAEYPDVSVSPLFKDLLDKHGLNSDQLILGNGSDEILQLIALAYVGVGDAVMTSTVTFSEYAFMAHLMGADLIEIPIQNNAYDLDAFKTRWTEKVKVICIANPNNPTGKIVTQQSLESLLEFVQGRSLVLLDEAYAEYVSDIDYPNCEALMKKYPNLIVTRTFSKLYGLASYRIGYGMGNKDVIHALLQVRQPFNVNGMALKAAELALKNKTFIQNSLKINQEGKKFLYDYFDHLGLIYQKSEANFIYVELGRPAQEIVQAMIKKGVIVRSMKSFGRPQGLRITIGTQDQLSLFKSAFESVYS